MSFSLDLSDDDDSDSSRGEVQMMIRSDHSIVVAVTNSNDTNNNNNNNNNIDINEDGDDDDEDLQLIKEEEAALKLENALNDALLNDDDSSSSSCHNKRESTGSIRNKGNDNHQQLSQSSVLLESIEKVSTSDNDMKQSVHPTNGDISVVLGETLRLSGGVGGGRDDGVIIGTALHKHVPSMIDKSYAPALSENNLTLNNLLDRSNPTVDCKITYSAKDVSIKSKIFSGEARIMPNSTTDINEMVECVAIFDEPQQSYVLEMVDFGVYNAIEKKVQPNEMSCFSTTESDSAALVLADPRLQAQVAEKQVKDLKRKRPRKKAVQGMTSEHVEKKTPKRVSKSGFYGVYAIPSKKVESGMEYIAKATISGKLTRLGKFESAIEAAKCYDAAVLGLGRTQRLNFPTDKS